MKSVDNQNKAILTIHKKATENTEFEKWMKPNTVEEFNEMKLKEILHYFDNLPKTPYETTPKKNSRKVTIIATILQRQKYLSEEVILHFMIF